MRFFISDNTDAFFNLATEQYLLHNFSEDVLFLWRSHNAVVLGKHQNACAEANYEYCKNNDIKIARRLSGGGTVFHDLGNINFTLIRNLKDGMSKAVDYRYLLEPIRTVLANLNIETAYSKRDDLLLNELKISGNAQHIHQKGLRNLHHGTLLYDSDLKKLNTAIRSEGIYEGKSVPSNRSDVTNIREYHDYGVTEDFLKLFGNGLQTYFGASNIPLNSNESIEINHILMDKFIRESWILGYSPKYLHKRNFNFGGFEYQIEMEVQDGIINRLDIKASLDTALPLNYEKLVGTELEWDKICTGYTEKDKLWLIKLF